MGDFMLTVLALLVALLLPATSSPPGNVSGKVEVWKAGAVQPDESRLFELLGTGHDSIFAATVDSVKPPGNTRGRPGEPGRP